jgi:hypothetical protein
VLQEEIPQQPPQQPNPNQFPPNWWNAPPGMMPPGMDMPNNWPPQAPQNGEAPNTPQTDNIPEDISDLNPDMQFALQQIESMQFQLASVSRQLELLQGYLISQSRNAPPTQQPQSFHHPEPTQSSQPRQPQPPQPSDFDMSEEEELARAIEESKKLSPSSTTTTTTTTTTSTSSSLNTSQNLTDSKERENEDPERSELRKRWALRYSQQ